MRNVVCTTTFSSDSRHRVGAKLRAVSIAEESPGNDQFGRGTVQPNFDGLYGESLGDFLHCGDSF